MPYALCSRRRGAGKSFTDLLDSFFTTHNTIKENLKQLGNGMPDMEKKERVRIKGFAAYKDNSTELKGDELPLFLLPVQPINESCKL